MTDFGYAGKILQIDLSSGKSESLPSSEYTAGFLGGRGLAAKLYWDLVPPQTGPFDPANALIYTTGPATGFTGLASSRWQVCGKSPAMSPAVFSHANFGEKWGSLLKFAGYDALVVQGQSPGPCYLYIDNSKVEIRDASTIWGRSTFETVDILKPEMGRNAGVIAIGPAGENRVSFATMLADDGASGAGGLGAVMGSKNLKAIVVAGDNQPVPSDPDRLEELKKRLRENRRDTWKDYLLNIPDRVKSHACNGCGIGCWRKSYIAEGGRRFKFFCQSGAFYMKKAQEYDPNWVETTLSASRSCDRWGLDTTVVQPMIDWLERCCREGLIKESETGLPVSKAGSSEFIETLTRKVALREGFGDFLAGGMLNAAEKMGPQAKGLLSHSILTRGNETRDYDPRLILTNVLLYATEPRRPISEIHELSHAMEAWLNWQQNKPQAFLSYNDFLNVARNFWGGEDAADFTTFSGKALAARKIQDRTYAKECLILCDFLWPVIWVRFAEDHTGDPSLESQVLAAITGRQIDQAGLDKIGERVFNLQRLIHLREGWDGRKDDRLLDFLYDEPLHPTHRLRDLTVPGPHGQPVSREGASISREDFEKLKSEYYGLRGWDKNGRPTKERLIDLGMLSML